jgi:hypothetical protein
MPFVIKFIKDFEFVGTEPVTGTLEDAAVFASKKLIEYDADTAAVMDDADLKGEPRALVSKDA